MSGGQRAKLELIRSVFLRNVCPDVLLLDEVFAPLDSASKLLIMRRLRRFCSTSLVLVIYHADAREAAASSERLDESAATARDVAQGSTRAAGSTPSELADVCSAGSGSFFDGVVRFASDGNVTFDPATDRCASS